MKKYSFDELIGIMEFLRGPKGCPWDREQTHLSLVKYLEEETREVIENIEKGSFEYDLKDELGDLLLQVLFHAQIAHEEDRFDISDVVDHLARKLKRRHPHVFGDKKIKDINELKEMWGRIKEEERREKE